MSEDPYQDQESVPGLRGAVPGLREPAPRKPRGCLFWGCLTLFIVLLAGGGCTGVLVYMGHRAVMESTAPAPVPIPIHEARPGELESIREAADSYRRAAQAGRPAELVLAADDLNALLAEGGYSGRVFARIGEDRLFFDVSVPLGEEVPFYAGRHFNAEIGLVPELRDGRLNVITDSATVNGRPVGERVSDAFVLVFIQVLLEEHARGLAGLAEDASSLELRGGTLILRR